MRSKRKEKKKKGRHNKKKFNLIPKSPILLILLLLVLFVEAFFLLLIATLNILPGVLATVVMVLLILLALVCMKLLGAEKKKSKQRKAGVVVSILLILVLGVGSYFLFNTFDTLNKISKEKTQMEDFHVVVLEEGSYEIIDDIKGKEVYVSNNKSDSYKEAKGRLMSEADVTYKKTTDYMDLGAKLVDKEKTTDNVIFLSETYYTMLCEEVDGYDEATKIIYTISVEVGLNDFAKRVDVTKDPFNIYITGIDTAGNISNVARSDVNMIMTVNPETRDVLLTSIPRDMYLPLHSYGKLDKLTHSGIYGVEETIGTVEDWLDVDVNYYVRVNFSTVVDIVDALGGIEVESDKAFTSRIGRYNFVAGTNHVNGEQALAFARERYAFAQGDHQRVQNQQRVLTGIINKVTGSTAILTSYTKLLNAVEDKMQTSLNNNDFSSLVKMQLGDMRGWNIETIAIKGTGAMKPTYSMGSINLSVVIPDEESVAEAQSAISKTMYPVSN